MTGSENDADSSEGWDEFGFFQELVEVMGVGVGVYGDDGRFKYVNEAYAEILGADKEAIEGKAVWEINPQFDRDRFDDYWASINEGETRTSETLHALEGRETPVRTVTTCREIGNTSYHFGTIQDITDRKVQEERFQAFVELSNDILAILNPDGTYQYLSPSAERILGYDTEALIGNDAFEYIHPDDRETVRDQFGQSIADPEAVPVTEYRIQLSDGSWGWLESRGNNQLENPAVEGFVVNSRDITESKEHERQIADLHDATREMVQAADENGICEIAVRTAEETLDFAITGVWLVDEGGARLEPAATSARAEELFGEHPVYTEGNSLSWQAFTEGESFVIDDLQDEAGLYNPDTQVRSELIVPIGEYGVLNVAAMAPNAFSDSDIAIAKLLAANTQVALGRAERERHLERQTDQMEFFNSILRHDILNAVTVIKSRAEFLMDDLEGEQLRDAETIVNWSNDVTEIVQQVRTVLETLVGRGDPELEQVNLANRLRGEIGRLESTYPEVVFDTDIPDEVPVLADELVGAVLGNVLTNAIEHNDTDGLEVSTTLEGRDDAVVVRIADNGKGVADDRKEAIFRRDETGHAKSTGSGFGLFFVDVMVALYGGDVKVEDNDDGGATFVIHFPTAERNDDG